MKKPATTYANLSKTAKELQQENARLTHRVADLQDRVHFLAKHVETLKGENAHLRQTISRGWLHRLRSKFFKEATV